MKMKSILLASTALLALSANAFAADKETYQSDIRIEKDSAGNYTDEETVTRTGIDKTTVKSEKKISISVDDKGNIDKSKTIKMVTDPKGLGNEHVVTTTDTETTKDGQVTTTHKKTVNGKNVEGTTDSYNTSSTIQKDRKGNYEERDITIKTDADGTTTSYEKNASVDVGAGGDVNKVTTTQKTVDPKGLGNKSTVSTSNTEKTKDGMTEKNREVSVDGKVTDSKSTMSPAR
jgi:hypothetical protein